MLDPAARIIREVFDDIKAAQAAEQSPGVGHNGSPFTEDPLPLYREVPSGEPFPVEALGSTLGDMAKALREAAVQSPMAICGTAVLAAAACATQALRNVELPIVGGQCKPLSLYFMTRAQYGERKTATDTQALRPLNDRAKELRQDFDAKSLSYRNALDVWTAQRQRIVKNKQLDASKQKSELEFLGAEPSPPKSPILTLQEPTLEGLTKHLKIGYPSIGLFSSEGGQFIGGHAMSDDAKRRSAAALNALWDDGKLERIRATEEAAILPGRRLSVFLQAQPDVAQGFLADPVLRDIGLLARFLITQPDSTMGSRRFSEMAAHHKLAIATYGVRMLALLRRDLSYDERADGLELPALAMTGATRAEWIDFANHIEELLAPGKELHEIAGFASKVAEHAARIAGVLQVFDDPEAEEMELDYLQRGIEIAQFYEALRLHSASRIGVELRDAERLRLWLTERWHEPYVTLRVIQQRGPTSLREKERIERLMRILEQHGWAAQTKGVTVEGKPVRTAWVIWGKVS